MVGISLEAARGMLADCGPVLFRHKVCEAMGLGKVVGNRYVPNRDLESGRPVLESTRETISPDRLNMDVIRSVLLGDTSDAYQKLGQSHRAAQECNVLENSFDVRPTDFANISAYNSTVIGLLEAKVLQAYQGPEFIMDSVFKSDPSNLRAAKRIGISNIGDVAQERKPGQPHARAMLTDRYTITPDTVNTALAIDVTREAAMFSGDLGNQLLTQAKGVGEAVRRRKEYRCIDVFLGVTNPYNYNGTSYNTYLTSGAWTNSRSLPFVDWQTVDTAMQAFVGLTNPETGEPITVIPKDAFVMPAKWATVKKFLTDTSVQTRTQSQAVVAAGSNPYAGAFNVVNPMTYQYAMVRATASSGLNLSSSNAGQYWWLGNFNEAFAYLENMPLMTQTEYTDGYTSKDRGLIFSTFVDEMGVPYVKDPRQVQRFTN